MPKFRNTMGNEVCQGCLTSGRNLIPIKEYLRLYQKLMEDVISDQIKQKKVPLMCCDCRSILKTVRKFQKRAKKAYETLVMKINLDDKKIYNPHISSLTTCASRCPDYEGCGDLRKLSADDIIKSHNNIQVNHEQSEEVKTEFGDAEEIKEERDDYDDIKLENDIIENVTEGTEYTDSIDIEAAVKKEVSATVSEFKKQIKLVKAKLSREAKYKVIKKMDHQSFSELCLAVKIDDEERQRCIQMIRISVDYLNTNFKCDKCIVGFSTRQKYEKHLRIYHSESNQYECELCGARVSTKLSLTKHVKGHRYKYVCTLCNHEHLNKRAVYAHLAQTHRIAYQCRECGLRFQDKYKEFYRHYNSMHRRYICDYCGFGGMSKKRLINHIRVNHCENICKYCNKRYAVYHSMTRHIALRHTKEVTEESYCVECNMQFDNIMLYTRHLKTSVKHKPKIVFPCTECPNVYAKKTAMMNHYKYIHLQKTNYYCDKCSRYFLNGFRLRTHIATYHNNIQAPKNKICSYCGRGFVTNRILDNHIRTHTGERPFACSHCTATFAQKSALVTHARAIHKVMMRYATKE